MRRLLFAGILSSTAAFAADKDFSPTEHVAAPGGKTVFYIMSGGKDGGQRRIVKMWSGLKQTLLEDKPANDPKQNLTGFSNLKLTTDGRVLYFNTDAWATSPAIHSLDLPSGKSSFVSDGALICVISNGEYQGDLMVSQHRYFVQGGSYEAINLIRPNGTAVGPVSFDADGAESGGLAKLCLSLGQ